MSLVYKKIMSAGIATANTDTTVYTVAATQRVVGQILVINTNPTSNVTVRLGIVENSDTLSAEDYLAYDLELLPNEVVSYSAITIGEGDFIVFRSNTVSSVTAGTGAIIHLYGELDTLVV